MPLGIAPAFRGVPVSAPAARESLHREVTGTGTFEDRQPAQMALTQEIVKSFPTYGDALRRVTEESSFRVEDLHLTSQWRREFLFNRLRD